MAFSLAVAQAGIGSPWDDLIVAQAGDRGLAMLVKAVIAHESQWNPNAENPADPSVGLMQLLVGPGGPYPSLSASALLEPSTNIVLGTRHLVSLVARYGLTPDAIAAYNAGSPRKNSANQYVNSVGDPMVQRYVDSVQTYWAWYMNNDPLFGAPSEGATYTDEAWGPSESLDLFQSIDTMQIATATVGSLISVGVLALLGLVVLSRGGTD